MWHPHSGSALPHKRGARPQTHLPHFCAVNNTRKEQRSQQPNAPVCQVHRQRGMPGHWGLRPRPSSGAHVQGTPGCTGPAIQAAHGTFSSGDAQSRNAQSQCARSPELSAPTHSPPPTRPGIHRQAKPDTQLARPVVVTKQDLHIMAPCPVLLLVLHVAQPPAVVCCNPKPLGLAPQLLPSRRSMCMIRGAARRRRPGAAPTAAVPAAHHQQRNAKPRGLPTPNLRWCQQKLCRAPARSP